MHIRKATEDDWESIWPIFREIIKSGETYAYETNTSKQQGLEIWLTSPRETFVYEEHGKILATYYIKTNQSGPGKHVCNCGYMVSSSARGRGLATEMCRHSQKTALKLGYKAMQFNFVASSNTSAIHLWKKLGFKTVGSLPKAFNHPKQGLIDAFIMYKWLN